MKGQCLQDNSECVTLIEDNEPKLVKNQTDSRKSEHNQENEGCRNIKR